MFHSWMDISTTPSVPTSNSEPESLTRTRPREPLSLTNGALKRHPSGPAAAVNYNECLKNHAASSGGYVVDGCCEFMPSPTSLNCAACGCHRNFHRRDPDDPPPRSHQHLTDDQPHRRHHPSPIPSSQMLLSLSAAVPGPQQDNNPEINPGGGTNPGNRKRIRSKFTEDQKQRMYGFAEKINWKMQRMDEELITGFCGEIGVRKRVFKVWMHNHKKNCFVKREINNNNNNNNNICADIGKRNSFNGSSSSSDG